MDTLIAAFAILVHVGFTGGAKLTLTPDTIHLSDSSRVGKVTLTCSVADNVNPTAIISLTVQRVTSLSDARKMSRELVAKAHNDGDSTQMIYSNLTAINITADLVAKRPMKIVMSRVGCDDAGLYTCIAAYNADGVSSVLLSENSRRLVVTAGPGPVIMTRLPYAKSYPIGIQLQLRCSATFGSAFSAARHKSKWAWQYKNAKSATWNLFAGRRSEAPLTQNGCELIGATSIAFEVEEEDDGRTYRCVLKYVTSGLDDRNVIYTARNYTKLSVETGQYNRLKLTDTSAPGVVGQDVVKSCWIITDLPDPAKPAPITVSLSDRDTSLSMENSVSNDSRPQFKKYVTTVTFPLALRHQGTYLTCFARFGPFFISTRSVLSVIKDPEPVTVRGPRIIEAGSSTTWVCEANNATKTPAALTWVYPGSKTGATNATTSDRVINSTFKGLTMYNASTTLTMFIPVLTPSFTLQCIGSYEPTNWLQSVNYSITVVDQDDCADNQCQNGATCRDRVMGYVCECVLGYSGTMCDIDIDNCVDNLCQNGATCADQVNGYGCICKPGYTSWLCEEDVDECASNPCRNGGNCTQHVINGYNCTCAIGFVGDNCEINFDDCGKDNPCKNGATCVDKNASFECVCSPGFVGQLCQNDFDECSTEPCRNGATCENLYNDYRCVCVPGFAGKKCESDVDECASYPCKNGAQCMDLFGDYICTCRIGFKGRHCQFDLRVFLDFRPSPRITYTKYASVDVICCRPPDVDSSEMHELAIYLTQDRLPPKMWLVANMVKTDNGFKTRNVVKFTKSSVIEDEDKMCLTFSMGQATCEDSGLYTCRATYSVHGFAGKQTEERSEELVIQVMPGVVITQVVKKANLFVENENVTFHCNETFPLTYDKPLWRWEMKETPETNWKTYSKADIRVSKPVKVDGCRQWQTTTLTHKIKYPDDNGTMYRCHIFQHGALMGPVGLFTVDKVTSAAKLDVAASENVGEVTWLSSMKSLGMYLAFGMTVTVAALTVFAYIHHQQTIKNREKEEREQRMWRCRRLPTAYE